MKKILLLLMVISMSACAVTGDKNSGSGDSGDGGTTNPEVDPDTNPTAKRFIANLRGLGSLYTGGSDVNIGENGTITQTVASVPPTTYTYYLKEVKNDTQAIYSTTNSFEYLGVEWKSVGHTGFSIEDNAIWGYNPINNEHIIKQLNTDITDPDNKDLYESTVKLANAAELISFDNPGFRFFYKRDNSSLTDNNTLNLKNSYTKDDVILDYTINPTIYKEYITNSVTVTVSPDKNTISYTKPQASPQPNIPSSIDRVFTFYKMIGSEAIYTVPITSGTITPVYYYTIAIKDNTIYMGQAIKLNSDSTWVYDKNQRSIGYWLH